MESLNEKGVLPYPEMDYVVREWKVKKTLLCSWTA
jgi:hypothetical protein